MNITRRNALLSTILPVLRPDRLMAAIPKTPKRLVVIFTPNGTVPSAFWPTGGETDFKLGPILEPLEAHRRRLLVLEGVNMQSRGTGPGNGHTQGIGHLLTGTPLLPGVLVDGMGRPSGYAGGVSVDQEIANHISVGARVHSLPLGVRVIVPATPVRARLSYRGANQPLVPNDDPYDVFDGLFGGLAGTPQEQAKVVGQRRSVLDKTRHDIQRLMAEVGAEDRRRLESHLQSIREVESNLAPSANRCAVPPVSKTRIDVTANDEYPNVSRLQMDLIATALACDVTRVVSLLYSSTQSGQSFTWLGSTRGHHSLSHEPDSNIEVQNTLVSINRWYAGEMRYLLDRLAALPEGNGSVLDSTLVVWCNELGVGNTHSKLNLPFVMAGGGAGFRMGRHVRYGGEGQSHNNLLVSLCNAFGVPRESFGDPRFCSGALPNLV